MQGELEVVASADSAMGARIRRVAEERSRTSDEILIENEVNVLGAFEAGVEVRHLFVSARSADSDVVRERAADIPTAVVSDEALAELFPRTRVPRMFAIARLPERQRFKAIAGSPGDVVVLDALAGPGNIGSIIRISAAFEASAVVFLDRQRADVYRRGVVRASAGTMFTLPLITATTASFVKFCRASGTRIATTSPHATGDFDEVIASPDRLALVLGSETRGCSEELQEAADVLFRIPMSERVESLNVSAAASVLLFERSPFRRGAAARPR